MSELRRTADAVIAIEREAGTPEAAEARRLLAAHLTALGYDVETQRFRFAPSALNAFPLVGAGLGWLTVVTIPLLLFPPAPGWAALAVWLAGLIALALVARGIAMGWGGAGDMREDANLVARRPGATVRRWIVAHADTKAQGHSMAGRLVAVWIVIGAVAAVTALAAARLGGAVSPWAVAPAAALVLAAGIAAGRGRLRGRSRGARDNGSGLVAALAAAETSTDTGTGILVTGAEEFGLVGARAFAELARERLAGTEVVNVDTVDERGMLYLVSHDGPGERLAGALAPTLASLGIPVRRRRLPLGIFVDSHPLARAGAAAVTIGRLDRRTLRLLHTPDDLPDSISFDTAERLGRLLGGRIDVSAGPG